MSACLVLGACDWSSTRPEPAGLELNAGPHLLLDGHLIETAAGVQRTVRQPARDPSIPNPLITGAEDRNSQPYLSVLHEGGRFRIWYNVPIDDRGSDRTHLGYMESDDGIRWQRPHRVLPDPEGGIRFGASVIRRPEGGYALGYHHNGGLKVATSEDGFSWDLVHPKELIKHEHDIAGLAYDPIRGHYLAVVSDLRWIDDGGRARATRRMPQQSVSTNLLDWATPWDAISPDFRDNEATQFYAFDAFVARGDLLVAMVKVLREDLDADGRAPEGEEPRGIGYTTLAWSRDGRTWTRDRAPYLTPDPTPGRWDHAMAWIDEQVPVGDSVYLYYAGYKTGHKGDRTRERQIGLAIIPRDRYAGWEAGSSGGVLRSRLLRTRGTGLSFNVDASAGEMRVRVLDFSGRDLLGRCEPIRGDHLDAPLRCERDIATLKRPFRLEFTLRDARLYAWSVLD